jgi:hypothetical protein
MMRWFGRLLWLIVAAAFICLPPIAASAATASAMPSVSHHCADCPPPPCPESDNAKHAAGLCCPFMVQAMGLLSPAVVIESFGDADIFLVSAGRDLNGLSPHQDPPPPRV